jgi:tetratricopeptide (TPR) repeat protein
MRFLWQKMFFSVLLLITTLASGQSEKKPKVEKLFFKGGEIAKENFIGPEKTIDSIKTYYQSGQLDERFYFNKKGQLDGLGLKNSEDGMVMVTWLYKKGVLLERKDYLKKPSNIKTKKQVDFNYANIKSCDSILKINPKRVEIIYSRACSQNYLGENILSEIDFVFLKNSLEKLKSNTPSTNTLVRDDINKKLADVYGRLSTIYNRFDNQLLSLEYLYKAVQANPTSNIHRYNLGAAFATQVEDYRLALYYLNEVVQEKPNHNFANWVLGLIYLELEEYQKSLNCLNIAFKGEGGLYENGYGTVESDLRTLRGLVYHKLGKTDLGITNLNKALEINDKNSMAHKHLGIIYQDLGNNEKACEYFQKSRTLGYEKKYPKKNLSSFINKTCMVANSIAMIPTEKEAESKAENDNQKSVSITEKPIKDLPYIAPNPAENFVEVFNFDGLNFDFTIYNVAGSQISKGVSNLKTIQVADIPSGFYILIIEIEGRTERFKLLKK